MEARHDVVIAGGGPAGLALAAALAGRGLDVLVAERGAHIGLPVRTSGGSWIPDLRRLGLPEHLWHPLTRLSLRSRRRTLVVGWQEPHGCVLDVTATWRHLAAEARAAGAHVVTGTSAVWAGPGRLLLRGGGERCVRCRLAVDATGVWAALARAAGIHPGFPRLGVGYEQELLAPAFPQEEAMLFVGGVAPGGYAWAFPRGGGRVRLGVGIVRPDVAASPRRLYPELARLLGPQLAAAQTLERHSGRIPSGPAPRRLVADGLLVLGDAGAQSNPLVGEGIRHVVAAARAAAPIAAAALERPGLADRSRLAAWERRGRAERGRGWGLALRANRFAARLEDNDWDRALEQLAAFSPEAMTALLRAEVLGLPLLAGALRSGPRAAWRVARPFLRGRAAGAAA